MKVRLMDTDFEALSPGELDAMVARLVFRSPPPRDSLVMPHSALHQRHGSWFRTRSLMKGDVSPWSPFGYSARGGLHLDVIDRMHRLGFTLSVEQYRKGTPMGLHVSFFKREPVQSYSTGTTDLPRAVCIAALKAVTHILWCEKGR